MGQMKVCAGKDLSIGFYGTGAKNYNKRCIIAFYRNTDREFNFSPYIRVMGKGNKLGTPSTGIELKKNQLAIYKRSLIDELKKFEGRHVLSYDETFKCYYIDLDQQTETEPQPEEVPAPVKVKKAKAEPADAPEQKVKSAEACVQDVLLSLMFECVDTEDVNGAKALLKAYRRFDPKTA